MDTHHAPAQSGPSPFIPLFSTPRRPRRHTIRCSMCRRFVGNSNIATSSGSWMKPACTCEWCFRRMEVMPA